MIASDRFPNSVANPEDGFQSPKKRVLETSLVRLALRHRKRFRTTQSRRRLLIISMVLLAVGFAASSTEPDGGNGAKDSSATPRVLLAQTPVPGLTSTALSDSVEEPEPVPLPIASSTEEVATQRSQGTEASLPPRRPEALISKRKKSNIERIADARSPALEGSTHLSEARSHQQPAVKKALVAPSTKLAAAASPRPTNGKPIGRNKKEERVAVVEQASQSEGGPSDNILQHALDALRTLGLGE